MTNARTQAENVTMSTGGLYSLATVGAMHVIDNATPRVIRALEGIKAENDSAWTFSDMGCADGGTSLNLWRSVLQHLNGRGCDSDVQIVYADQSRNDFNALVQILHGHTSFASYLAEFPNARVLQSGASFYTPVLAKSSLHLGFSATAMHWLSSKPADITDHVHMVGANSQDRALYAQQAAADWETILLHRARELTSGGKLVLVNFCIDEHGQYLGSTGGVNMFDTLNNLWQNWADDGTVTAAEYHAMTLPQYYNSVEEFSAPLMDSNSAVYKAGLRLVDIETAVVPCPFAESFKTHRDANKFADAYIPTIRSWNESIFHAALSSERSAQERQELIDAYYGSYRQLVATQPEGHGMGYAHAYMTIEKV